MGDDVQLPLWPGLSAKADKHVEKREHKQRADEDLVATRVEMYVR